MCTAVPPPSPPQPPKYVPKDPPIPPKPTIHGPYSAKTLQLIRENHGGGVQYFVDGVLNRRAMYRFAVQQPKKNPLRVWQEGMGISRSHFLSGDEEHAAVVLEILCATPKPPRIPKPAPPPVPRWPLPPPPSDQVTLTQYSRHRRTSLLPLAPAPKRPCPTPQYGSLLQRRASQSAPPRSDRYSIVTSGFGIDSALTSAIVWVPGREHPLHYRDCGDMEEQCHRATVVVIAEAERDGVRGGGHFRGAVFDHSLHVAPFCTLHGMMGILAYKRGPVGGVRAWHLQLGVGGMKGHTN